MIALPSIARATRQDWDVPYVPTPPEVAEATRYRGIVAERAITSDPASRPAWSAERAE